MGLVGAGLIAGWSLELMRRAGRVLLDITPDAATVREIRSPLEGGDVRVSDLHLWQVGRRWPISRA
jgi:Co/Zn/Cd efflux system component